MRHSSALDSKAGGTSRERRSLNHISTGVLAPAAPQAVTLADTAQAQDALDVRRIYLWSFLLRFAAGIVGWLLTVWFALPFLQDAFSYEEIGASIANDWLAGRSSAWLDAVVSNPNTHEAWGITVFIAVFYWLLGGFRAIPVLIAVYSLFTAIAPVLVYRIARQLGAAPNTARVGAWLTVFSPAFAFWAGALYKEGLVLLLLLLAMYHVLRLQAKLSLWSVAILTFSLIALFSLRSYLSLAASAVAVIGLVFGRSATAKPGTAPLTLLRQGLIIGLFVAAMAVVGFTSTLQQVVPTDTQSVFSQIQSSRSDLATAGSGYLPGADVSTPEAAVAFLPVGLFYFLTVPWPWDLGALRQTLIIPETAFWVLLYPVLLLGMVRGLRRNFQGSILLVTMSMAICIFYAIFIGNIGTAYRLRIQVWVLWAVFAGWGWEWLQEKFASRRTLRIPRKTSLTLPPARPARTRPASPRLAGRRE